MKDGESEEIFVPSDRKMLNPLYSHKWINRDYQYSRDPDYLSKMKELGWELVFEAKYCGYDSFWRRRLSKEDIEERKRMSFYEMGNI
jgi:hypothetical protein